GVTLSSDGTTHKNTTYQSHHLTYADPKANKPVTRFIGFLHEVNHTSDTQLEGWQELLTSMSQTYNECMGSQLDWREVVEKVKGMLMDHAEDQKKLVRLFLEWKRLCEREVQGERALACLPPEDVAALLWQLMGKLLEEAGGLEGWESLSNEEQQRRTETARHALHHQIGVERFNLLSPAEQAATDFFVWAGCCMHKELNAVKGGNTAMTAWWQENGIEPPIVLMNKDNAAAAVSGSSEVTKRALQVSGRGAVKALDLTGSVFRHKDDKKGQQDSLRYFLEVQLGYFLPWPDTSNTQYQSHCNGASAWLVYGPLYSPYLKIIRDRKDTRSFTNIEQNVYNAFKCTKTAEEMACLSTWGNCIGHPYMRQVRGHFRDFSNALDLGPLHAKLLSHLNSLSTNLDLILAPDTTYHEATFDGKPFEHLEAFYIIQTMARDTETYPNLRPLLKAFLQGAIKTLVRFTTEFAPGGAITNSTPAQRGLACMETTNDANEGALGTLRITLRRAPRMSLVQLNAQLKYKKNNTGRFVKTYLGPTARKFLRRKARILRTLGLEKKRRCAQVAYDKKVVQKHRDDDKRRAAQKDAEAAKFAAYIPHTTEAELLKMKVAEINFQIRWHRHFDTQVAREKDLGKRKEERLVVLQDAIGRLNHGVVKPKDGLDTRVECEDNSNNITTGEPTLGASGDEPEKTSDTEDDNF
ncbi:hypothetical protein PAXINDRAFT_83254, partial [Paxillus involutus ATCC 200175]